jgi:hypothetical protein
LGVFHLVRFFLAALLVACAFASAIPLLAQDSSTTDGDADDAAPVAVPIPVSFGPGADASQPAMNRMIGPRISVTVQRAGWPTPPAGWTAQHPNAQLFGVTLHVVRYDTPECPCANAVFDTGDLRVQAGDPPSVARGAPMPGLLVDQLWHESRLQPGDVTDGVVYFEIKANAEPTLLEWDPARDQHWEIALADVPG